MSNLLFIDDFFLDQVIGGGELNNAELIHNLIKNGWNVLKKQSHLVDNKSLDGVDAILVSNFSNLQNKTINNISNGKTPYIIYEHDHKYIRSRNPAIYKNFIAPKSEIINFDFYKNASSVFCQSEFHKKIVKKNLNLDNIKNLSGNLWSDDHLELFKKYSRIEKKDKASIIYAREAHKNTLGAEYFCKKNSITYEIISPDIPNQFYKNLSKNKHLIFFPKTPETLSRVAVESRMMNISLKTNNLVGATGEPWFKMKGEELINYIYEKKADILRTVENAF